jgi:hypothetical protein
MTRHAAPTTSTPALVRWIVIGLLLLGVVGTFYLTTRADQAWLEDVATYDYEAGIHVEAGLGYKESPAVGGPHHPIWQNCGVYTSPLAQEHVVHSLEHGAVWIAYDPAQLDAAAVRALAAAHGTNDYVIISPYPGLDSPVVASAWNRQLRLDGPTDERLVKFVTTFANGAQAPEPGAPCDGGTDTTGSVLTPPAGEDPANGGGAIAQNSADTLLGLSETQAEARAGELGWQFRIGERDGEQFMLTEDYVAMRVTVIVTNGVVTKVRVG